MKNGKITSIKTNYIFNLAYQFLAICVPLLTTPYVSRILHADGVGQYSYNLSIVTYFSIFGTLGISTYGQLITSENRENTYELSKRFIEIVIGRVLTTMTMTILYILMIPLLGKDKKMYILLLIYLFATMLDISWFLQGLELFRITVVRNFIIKILSTISIFLFVRNQDDLLLYVFILNFSTLVGNLFLWPYAKRYLIRVKLKDICFYQHWKYSISYFIPTVATSVYTVLDKSMIGLITGSVEENGFYEQAHKIENLLVTLITSLGTVTMPRIRYMYKNGEIDQIKGMVSKTVNFILELSLPICMGVIAVSDSFVPMFLGNEFSRSIVLVKIFSVLVVIVGLDNIIGKQCLMATGRQRFFNIGVIVGAGVNLIVNLFFIPHLQSVGAAIASVMAEGTILIIFLFFSKSYIDIRKFFIQFTKYFIFSLIMVGGIWVSKRFLYISTEWIMLFIQIGVGVITYLFVLFVTHDSLLFEMLNISINKIKRWIYG